MGIYRPSVSSSVPCSPGLRAAKACVPGAGTGPHRKASVSGWKSRNGRSQHKKAALVEGEGEGGAVRGSGRRYLPTRKTPPLCWLTLHGHSTEEKRAERPGMGWEALRTKAVWWLPGLMYGVGVEQQWVGPTANAHTIVLQLGDTNTNTNTGSGAAHWPHKLRIGTPWLCLSASVYRLVMVIPVRCVLP